MDNCVAAAATGAAQVTVSIVVDNFNYARFVGDAIASALSQTYPRVQVIVVDDGSTDASRSVIESFGDRIEAVFKPNQGQASAFNEGFRRSRGDVVLFLDADDLLMPSAAAVAVERLREAGTVKFHWPMWEIDEQGVRTGRLFPRQPLPEGDLGEVVIRRGPVSLAQPPTSGNAWSRAFLEQVMPLPEHEDKHGADGFLRKVAPLYGVMRRSEVPLGCYRVHAGNYGGGRGLLFTFRRGLGRYPAYCRLLAEHLARRGVTADVETWLGPGSEYRWLRDAVALHDDLEALLPEPALLILMDGGALGGELLDRHRVLPLVEHEGVYWGPPRDQEHALEEIARLRARGARYLVLAFTAFSWLDEYPALERYLSSRCTELLRNERVVVWDLGAAAAETI